HQIAERLRQTGIAGIVVGCDLDSSKKATELARVHPNLFAAVGIHPIHLDHYLDTSPLARQATIAKLQQLIDQEPTVVAIGEVGLDHYRLPGDQALHQPYLEAQEVWFKEFIELARANQLPLILHCREAYNRVLELLEAETEPLPRGTIHCFTGSLSQAKRFIKLGFYIGLTGIITYQPDLLVLAQELPLNRLLIETDAPYLTPLPWRQERVNGKIPRNQPAFVKAVAAKIAETKGIDESLVAEATRNNAQELFGLPLEPLEPQATVELVSAGGVVMTREPNPKIVVIVDRHGNPSLPKGHLEPDETSAEAALREVGEEIGLKLDQLTLGAELPSIHYQYLSNFASDLKKSGLSRGPILINKTVHFFAVTIEPVSLADLTPQAEEILEIEVLEVEAALARLTFGRYQEVVREAVAKLT
ncbi:MAG: TatD DNase family protein, partial [Candidatus Berkelbacteria bacterium Gr01-1014_85]